MDDIKLLLALLAYEAFIDPDNVARLGRLFNRLSMSPALMKKAEDVIVYTLDNVGYEHILLPGIDPDDASECEVYVELVKLAVDANFTNLLKLEKADGTTGDGQLMQELRRQIQGPARNYSSMEDPNLWPSLVELADFRYHEYFSSLWPDMRKVILSPEQLQTDDLKEPPSAEVAGYLWPALVQSAAARNTLELTKIDCIHGLESALGLNMYSDSCSYVIVRKHKTTGELGPEVAFPAVSTRIAERVAQRMPGIGFY